MASLVELLVKIQIIDERQHDAVMSRARSTAGGHVVQQVAELGYATEGTVARAVSVELGLPRIDLAITPPEPGALALLDVRTCAERFVLPVALRENGELLWLAMADPTDQEALSIVRRRTQKRVRPAVAGPTEILRTARAVYAAPNAGISRPEPVQDEKLAAIEIESVSAPQEAFEVVNVAEGLEGSALSRLARQLGVEVPPTIPSRATSQRARPAAPPPRPAQGLDEVLAPAPRCETIAAAQLSGDDLRTVSALRASMEKGALVLRVIAELCVEKGVFTREEMRVRNARKG